MFSKKADKKKSPQDSMDHDAKRSVITELRDVANEEMSKRIGSLKKSPLAPGNEHPKSGLDAAQQMMDSFDHESEDPMAKEPDGSTDEINQDSEYGDDNEEMSADDIDRKIAELENRKRQLASK